MCLHLKVNASIRIADTPQPCNDWCMNFNTTLIHFEKCIKVNSPFERTRESISFYTIVLNIGFESKHIKFLFHKSFHMAKKELKNLYYL